MYECPMCAQRYGTLPSLYEHSNTLHTRECDVEFQPEIRGILMAAASPCDYNQNICTIDSVARALAKRCASVVCACITNARI